MSTSVPWLSEPDTGKGSSAEGEHLLGCFSWAVTEYVPDCHKDL